ncbi:MAG: hypothetical protein R6U63_11730 [Longimicrobiales bacterium]
MTGESPPRGWEPRSLDPELGAVDRADYDPSYDPNAPVHCEVCGAEMYYTAACKLRCPRCGYTRDCSDP